MSKDELYLKVPADFKYNLMLWCLPIVNQIKGTRLLLDSECYVYTLRLNFRKEEKNLFELVKLNFDAPVKSTKYRQHNYC